ncbi:carbon storage regulator [Ferrimicrobium acidiphilum]|uniref:carbon storage regulator n=1 Tax=Ferrimicrobium acidiphilum TaxID=121039 RepID=UPI003C6DB124
MLVLRRTYGESVAIILPTGEVISVKVSEIGRHFVRLGFDAPSYIKIVRDNANPPNKKEQ